MGYSPASVATTTSGVNHLAQVFYDKAAVDNLKAHLPFYAACTRKKLPDRSGKTIQFFTYRLFAANTTPGSEGTVGTGLSPTTDTISVAVNQYYDFASFSDFLTETAIDDVVANTAAELGYRAALTVNTLLSGVFDTAVGTDASANILLSHSAFMSRSVAQQAVQSLRGKNVRAQENDMYYGIMHPFVAFDLFNDSATGGYIDWSKYHDSAYEQLQRGIQGFKVTDLAGCRWIETTTVPTYTINTFTNYGSYVVGKDAIMAVNLGGTEAPQDEKNFQLLLNRALGPSGFDPARVIASTAAYNFKFGASQRPGATMALRRIQSEASIS